MFYTVFQAYWVNKGQTSISKTRKEKIKMLLKYATNILLRSVLGLGGGGVTPACNAKTEEKYPETLAYPF